MNASISPKLRFIGDLSLIFGTFAHTNRCSSYTLRPNSSVIFLTDLALLSYVQCYLRQLACT